MSRCICCDASLTTGEMMFDLPNGEMNDTCWTCTGISDNPELCHTEHYQFEEYTELPVGHIVTPAKKIAY